MTAASPKNHTLKLVNHIPNSQGAIEVKKQKTFEHGVKSKVLVVHALEEYADDID